MVALPLYVRLSLKEEVSHNGEMVHRQAQLYKINKALILFFLPSVLLQPGQLLCLGAPS